MFEQNFIDGCLYGTTEIEDVDAYVEYWHTHDTANTLREFLGMTRYEYEEWIKHGDAILRDILRCRVDNTSLENYAYMSDEERIAARSYSIEDIEKLRNDDKHGYK